jgi:hypothetical protein
MHISIEWQPFRRFSVVGDEGVDAIFDAIDDGESEMLTHEWISGTTRHHGDEAPRKIMPSQE